VSEVNETGSSGGCVFTMDGITFGLEVCLDHGNKRRENYCANTWAPSGEPKVQVQLIPSCGMKIGNPCCVPQRLVFKVYVAHYAAKKDAGGTVVNERASHLTVSPHRRDREIEIDSLRSAW